MLDDGLDWEWSDPVSNNYESQMGHKYLSYKFQKGSSIAKVARGETDD